VAASSAATAAAAATAQAAAAASVVALAAGLSASTSSAGGLISVPAVMRAGEPVLLGTLAGAHFGGAVPASVVVTGLSGVNAVHGPVSSSQVPRASHAATTTTAATPQSTMLLLALVPDDPFNLDSYGAGTLTFLDAAGAQLCPAANVTLLPKEVNCGVRMYLKARDAVTNEELAAGNGKVSSDSDSGGGGSGGGGVSIMLTLVAANAAQPPIVFHPCNSSEGHYNPPLVPVGVYDERVTQWGAGAHLAPALRRVVVVPHETAAAAGGGGGGGYLEPSTTPYLLPRCQGNEVRVVLLWRPVGEPKTKTPPSSSKSSGHSVTGGLSVTGAGAAAVAADLDLHCFSPALEDVHYKAGASEGEGCKMERDALKPGTPEVMLVTPTASGDKRWVLSVHSFGGELKGTASIADSRAVVRVYTAAGLVAEFDARAAAAPADRAAPAAAADGTAGIERLGSRAGFAWWHVAAINAGDGGVPVIAPIMELSSHAHTPL
jgi:hypothetical protein